MLPELDHYDWEEVFKYANGGNDNGDGSGPQLCVGTVVTTGASFDAPFDREDVVEIKHMEEGENDGADWIIVVRLADGRWGYVEAGCDYTGWG